MRGAVPQLERDGFLPWRCEEQGVVLRRVSGDEKETTMTKNDTYLLVHRKETLRALWWHPQVRRLSFGFFSGKVMSGVHVVGRVTTASVPRNADCKQHSFSRLVGLFSIASMLGLASLGFCLACNYHMSAFSLLHSYDFVEVDLDAFERD